MALQAQAGKKMVEGDVAAMRQRSNRTALRKALAKCGLCCDDWDAVSITDCQLTRKGIEQIVGVAVAQQLAAEGSLAPAPGAGGDAAAAGQAAGGPGEPVATDAPAAGGDPGPAAVSEVDAPADGEGAAAMERCDSAEAEAGSTAVAGAPAAGMQQQEAQPPATAAQQEPGDAASPAAADAARQPSAMQTDGVEATAAGAAQATAAGPAATNVFSSCPKTPPCT